MLEQVYSIDTPIPILVEYFLTWEDNFVLDGVINQLNDYLLEHPEERAQFTTDVCLERYMFLCKNSKPALVLFTNLLIGQIELKQKVICLGGYELCMYLFEHHFPGRACRLAFALASGGIGNFINLGGIHKLIEWLPFSNTKINAKGGLRTLYFNNQDTVGPLLTDELRDNFDECLLRRQMEKININSDIIHMRR